jgi:hypothetical protein
MVSHCFRSSYTTIHNIVTVTAMQGTATARLRIWWGFFRTRIQNFLQNISMIMLLYKSIWTAIYVGETWSSSVIKYCPIIYAYYIHFHEKDFILQSTCICFKKSSKQSLHLHYLNTLFGFLFFEHRKQSLCSSFFLYH